MNKEDVFPDEYKQPFSGLLYVGKLQRTIEIAGHKILIKTLTQGEELRVGQLAKEYVGTRSELAAMQMYFVAAAIEAVDGMPLVKALSPDVDLIYEKAQVIKDWYASVVRDIYDEYTKMVKTAGKIASSLKK